MAIAARTDVAFQQCISPDCGATYSVDEVHTSCPACGNLLDVAYANARWCGLDPETGLAGTNSRFLDRFSRVEAALDGDLKGRSIGELEGLWQQAKAEIRAENTPTPGC